MDRLLRFGRAVALDALRAGGIMLGVFAILAAGLALMFGVVLGVGWLLGAKGYEESILWGMLTLLALTFAFGAFVAVRDLIRYVRHTWRRAAPRGTP